MIYYILFNIYNMYITYNIIIYNIANIMINDPQLGTVYVFAL